MTRDEAADVYQIVKAALAGQARETEKAIATVVKHIRANEIEPLRRQVDALSRDLALERRLAELEQRVASAGDVEAKIGNVARLRSAG